MFQAVGLFPALHKGTRKRLLVSVFLRSTCLITYYLVIYYVLSKDPRHAQDTQNQLSSVDQTPSSIFRRCGPHARPLRDWPPIVLFIQLLCRKFEPSPPLRSDSEWRPHFHPAVVEPERSRQTTVGTTTVTNLSKVSIFSESPEMCLKMVTL